VRSRISEAPARIRPAAVIPSLASVLLLAAAGALLLAVPADAQAQQQQQQQREPEARQVQALRERVYQALAKTQEHLEADNYAAARKELDAVRGIGDLNSYERGQILYFTGIIDYEQDNLQAAVRAFEQVVALPDLPQGFRTDTLWALVQLAMSAEMYQKAIEYGQQWLGMAENPSGDPYYLIAVAYYQLKQYRQSIENMTKAVQIAEADGRSAREDWYGLLRASYHELGDNRRLREVLEIMVARWPKKDYWLHLSAVYSDLNMERRQVAVLETMYEAGWMNRENEVLQLAQLLIQHGGAFKGAKIIEKGMNDNLVERNERNYRLLAQAWVQAQDDRRSIPPLREAAERSRDGQLHLQLAQSHLNLYQFNECIDAARTSIQRGGLNRPDTANMVLGSCLMELQRYDQAREAFRAARSDSRSRASADRWLDFIDRELARKRDIERQMSRLERG
jgi:tetratricopeptide (TPR) repeat protein